MKHLRKIMMLMLTVVFIAGCGAPKAEPYDYEKEHATLQKSYAYTLAKGQKTILDVYNNGGDQYQCFELLKMDYKSFEELKEDKKLSDYDHKTMLLLYANTYYFAEKIANADHDTTDYEKTLNQCIERLKKDENWEEW
ncbi:MAG: hypothetical protein U0L06_04365 [Agathobacter sp.]|nr:hypothetical protein [Agathobacter sp.]